MSEGGNQPRLDEDVLEGGRVEPLQDYTIAEHHRANTARYLALALVGILAMSVVLQYASTMILIYTGKADAIPNLDKMFNILMPVLVRVGRRRYDLLFYEGEAMIQAVKAPLQPKSFQAGVETKTVLNCYEILNARDFSWPVNVYRVEFADQSKQIHQSRGEAKDIIWRLRKGE